MKKIPACKDVSDIEKKAVFKVIKILRAAVKTFIFFISV